MSDKAFLEAKKIYESFGVDVDKAINTLRNTKVSIQCWQGDDVKGFYSSNDLSGGISVTGNYPYRANSVKALQDDLDVVLSLVPFKHKINLHAIYLDTKDAVELDQITPKHFSGWVDFAKERGLGLDFNPTLFSHPLSSSGFTLSSNDDSVRQFWIDHAKKSREIAAFFGKSLGIKSVCNLWIPDGYKDTPVSRLSPRKRLEDSLNQIYEKRYDKAYLLDTVESKLFGIGAESYTTGSHEFYLAYAVKNNLGLCLDSGHFHPTEHVYDKLSAVSPFIDELLLHVSRPVRWDSDHVVTLSDDLLEVMQALVNDDLLDKTHIGLDFFDASINRVAAWVIGIRNTQKALLKALLQPTAKLVELEEQKAYTERLALQEELKALPFGIIYDYLCETDNKPTGLNWLEVIKTYEETLKGKR